MIKLYHFDELKPEEILNRDIRAEKNVEDVVDAIIADVRARGDDALKDYALKFDGAAIENLQVTQAEIDEAFAGMDPYFLETLRQAAENIEQFHRQQVHKNFVMNDRPGIVLGQKYTPIEKAGVYVPGGTAAYPSTVRLAIIFILSVPLTGVAPGAAVKVTVPLSRFTVKSVPSFFSAQSPPLVITCTVTASASSPPKLSWNTFASLLVESTKKSSSNFGCSRFSPS